jgi:hypothetical protein
VSKRGVQCAGSMKPAQWINYPGMKAIQLPICPECGHNGFKCRSGGLVPVHKSTRDRTEKEWRTLEYNQQVRDRGKEN